MSHPFVRIYRAADRIEGHLLKGLLEQHGVQVRLLGDGLAGGVGELPADVMQVVLEVPPGFVDFARQLIEEYESRGRASAVDPRPWHCPVCAEDNPETFTVCWNCAAVRTAGGA